MNTTLTKSGTTAIINHKGAELISLKTNHREYIWEGNPEFWAKHSPILFPIVGTLKHNSYIYDGKSYYLPRHGFARDFVFELVSKTESNAIFSLKDNAESRQKYPFQFELQVCYTLDGDTLIIAYTVYNNGAFTMPFSIGAHPAFALRESFESYALQFGIDKELHSYELVDDLLSDKTNTIELENKTLPLTYSLFEKDALVFKSMDSKRIVLLENGSPLIGFSYDDFPNFGIWTKANAPFICLEPWIGYADTFESTGNILEKEGIRLLGAKSVFDAHFSIEIL